jgi:hypothetical protein
VIPDGQAIGRERDALHPRDRRRTLKLEPAREPADRQVLPGSNRFLNMGDEQHAAAGYVSRLVGGLVACAVVAVTLHAEVAAGTILATVMVLALAVGGLIARGAL